MEHSGNMSRGDLKKEFSPASNRVNYNVRDYREIYGV